MDRRRSRNRSRSRSTRAAAAGAKAAAAGAKAAAAGAKAAVAKAVAKAAVAKAAVAKAGANDAAGAPAAGPTGAQGQRALVIPSLACREIARNIASPRFLRDWGEATFLALQAVDKNRAEGWWYTPESRRDLTFHMTRVEMGQVEFWRLDVEEA